MALAVTITYIAKSGSQLRVGFKLTPSGTYVTGGDTVNLMTATQDPNFVGEAASLPIGPIAPLAFDIWDKSGNVGVTATTVVVPVAGTTPANCKMKYLSNLGTEGTGGSAYAASILAATLVGEATFNTL